MSSLSGEGCQQSLVEAIHQLASCPCATHEEGFLAAVARTREFLFQVAAASTDGRQPRENEQRPLRVENVTAAGHRFVLAFADLDAARRYSPTAQIAGIERDPAIRLVLADDRVDGVLFTAATDDGAWAAVDRSSLEWMLTSSRS